MYNLNEEEEFLYKLVLKHYKLPLTKEVCDFVSKLIYNELDYFKEEFAGELEEFNLKNEMEIEDNYTRPIDYSIAAKSNSVSYYNMGIHYD